MYLVSVLSSVELAVEKRDIGVGFVLDNLDTFAAARLVLRSLSDAVQLGYLILFHRHRQCYPKLLDNHGGVDNALKETVKEKKT